MIYTVIVLYLHEQIFHTQNYDILFKISASGLTLKIFLKFRIFQPRYPSETYSYKRKRVHMKDHEF